MSVVCALFGHRWVLAGWYGFVRMARCARCRGTRPGVWV